METEAPNVIETNELISKKNPLFKPLIRPNPSIIAITASNEFMQNGDYFKSKFVVQF